MQSACNIYGLAYRYIYTAFSACYVYLVADVDSSLATVQNTVAFVAYELTARDIDICGRISGIDSRSVV